ncbi:unnamed protein product [Brassica rapa subsp. narinosa]
MNRFLQSLKRVKDYDVLSENGFIFFCLIMCQVS